MELFSCHCNHRPTGPHVDISSNPDYMHIWSCQLCTCVYYEYLESTETTTDDT